MHISSPPGIAPHRRAGIVGHQAPDDSAMIVNGIRISEPPQLFLELATEIEHPWLVAVGDALVLNPRHPDPRSGHPFTTLEALTQALVDEDGGRQFARWREFDLVQSHRGKPCSESCSKMRDFPLLSAATQFMTASDT